jgi:hypothetical protein
MIPFQKTKDCNNNRLLSSALRLAVVVTTVVLFSNSTSYSQEKWLGEPVTITHGSNDSQYFDTLTTNVILTRGSQGLLYNAATENNAGQSSPDGVGWDLSNEVFADLTLDVLTDLGYQNLKPAANQNMRGVAGKTFVLHLEEDDIYLSFTFDSWGNKNQGASYEYTRTTPSEQTTSIGGNVEIPTSYGLGQNYPNPFNPTTSVTFDMATSGLVEINAYNILGKQVSQITQSYYAAGSHSVTFDATGLPSGSYFIRMAVPAENLSFTRQITLMK